MAEKFTPFSFGRNRFGDKVRSMNKMPDNKDVQAAMGAPAPRRSWAGRLLRLFVVALILAAAFAGWRMMMASAVRPRPHAAREAIEPVRIQPVHLTSAHPRWRLYGRAIALHQTILRMPVSGRIAATMPDLREGVAVKQGQMLVRLDDLPLRAAVEEAEAALKSAQAASRETRARLDLEIIAVKNARGQLDLALRELSRTQRLRKSGAVSDAALDKIRLSAAQRRLALAQRKANVEATRARLAQQQATVTRLQWALRRARRNLADTTLRAPFDGVIAQAAAVTGQQVSPADKLITLIPKQPPQVRLALSERQYGALKAAGEALIGRKLRITWRTSDGDIRLAAHVVRIAPQIAAGQGAVNIFAALDDAASASWLPPGTFVAAAMDGPLLKDVALLPEAAVYDGARVYVLKDGRIASREVTLRGYAGGKAVVSGLKEAQKVIVNRMAGPRDGRKAKVMGQ